jgi:hypothetical protein
MCRTYMRTCIAYASRTMDGGDGRSRMIPEACRELDPGGAGFPQR